MEGLDKFREAFEAYTDNYVIIGGTACDITMTGTEVQPRATHDIDMIVIVEKMSPEFGEKFWHFIKDAGYRPEKCNTKDGSPKYELYRFVDGKPGYPEMIELLSRHPDVLGLPQGFIIEPLPIGDEVSSLSAIILDDDYYHFTIDHSKITDGIRHADSAALVALKARAYLNLLRDKNDGKHVNSKDIKKHRSDILKNVVIMPEEEIEAPISIVECIKDFVSSIRNDWNELASPLAKSINQNEDFVDALLNQLNDLFTQRL
ncbi:MAG: hypothetical protein E7077_14910 [Bacteroidales bacterium]|jgi:hypothetical protein|nr:hypothetical protein [Bacteroidales bacterium]